MSGFEDVEEVVETPTDDAGESSDKGGADGGKVADKGGDKSKGKDGDGVTLTRKDYDALQRRLDELQESERYWADRAKGAKASGGDPSDEDDDQDDDPDLDEDPDKVLDEFSTKGIDALVKRGVLTKKAARELIRKEAEKIARQVVGSESKKLQSDAELLRKFPDLGDEKSDLFRRTAEIYQAEVKRDPALKRSTAALMLSARAAKAEIDAEKRASKRDESEESRLDRIRRQAGDSNRRGRADFEDDDEGDIGPEAKELISRMSRYGVTEDNFRKSREQFRDTGRRR